MTELIATIVLMKAAAQTATLLPSRAYHVHKQQGRNASSLQNLEDYKSDLYELMERLNERYGEKLELLALLEPMQRALEAADRFIEERCSSTITKVRDQVRVDQVEKEIAGQMNSLKDAVQTSAFRMMSHFFDALENNQLEMLSRFDGLETRIGRLQQRFERQRQEGSPDPAAQDGAEADAPSPGVSTSQDTLQLFGELGECLEPLHADLEGRIGAKIQEEHETTRREQRDGLDEIRERLARLEAQNQQVLECFTTSGARPPGGVRLLDLPHPPAIQKPVRESLLQRRALFPKPPNPYIARSSQREQLLDHLDGENGSPPLAVMGPPGVGKTAFMAKLAEELRDSESPYGDRIFWVDLDTEEDDLRQTWCRLARTLQIPFDKESPPEAIAQAVYAEPLEAACPLPCLIMFDNAEGDNVVPFLPPSEVREQYHTLVATRYRLLDLEHYLQLGSFSLEEAQSYVQEAINRIEYDPDAAGELIGLLERSPKALHLALRAPCAAPTLSGRVRVLRERGLLFLGSALRKLYGQDPWGSTLGMWNSDEFSGAGANSQTPSGGLGQHAADISLRVLHGYIARAREGFITHSEIRDCGKLYEISRALEDLVQTFIDSSRLTPDPDDLDRLIVAPMLRVALCKHLWHMDILKEADQKAAPCAGMMEICSASLDSITGSADSACSMSLEACQDSAEMIEGLITLLDRQTDAVDPPANILSKITFMRIRLHFWAGRYYPEDDARVRHFTRTIDLCTAREKAGDTYPSCTSFFCVACCDLVDTFSRQGNGDRAEDFLQRARQKQNRVGRDVAQIISRTAAQLEEPSAPAAAGSEDAEEPAAACAPRR